jgi:hypothetical protein
MLLKHYETLPVLESRFRTQMGPWMTLTMLFQGNESENCMWRLIDERWMDPCLPLIHGHLSSFNDLDL